MYYSTCKYSRKGNIECAIVYRDKNFYGEWGEEQELPKFINFPGYSTTHPSIGYDKINEREILFFSSDRPGGKGKLDLWYSTIAPNGKLTRPINHTLLNSRNNDVTPFFHSSTQTLYFSSDGYPGMGGYDIYKVKRIGRSWQTPVHMSFPINSSYNDFYYTLNESGEKSYFSSNREEAMEIDPEKEACCNDLFTAAMQPDKIEVTREEFLTYLNGADNRSTYVEQEPKVVIPSISVDDINDIPETILGGTSTRVKDGEIVLGEGPNSGQSTTTSNPSRDELNTKGDESFTSEKIEFDDNFESLPKDIYSLVFEIEVLDLDLEPLDGATVEFLEVLETGSNVKNFRKENINGNKVKFRIKDEASYKVVLSKVGFETDTFTIEKELLVGATDLQQSFFLSPQTEGSIYPESSMKDLLEEELMTEDSLKSFLPVRLYFNNDEPDPTSWSNTTNKNYEQTYILYYSKKDRFKDQNARKYAASQREEALLKVDDFFDNDLKNGNEQLKIFSKNLLKYIEQGNKVSIGLQPISSARAVSDRNTLLQKRRISCVKNHFMTYMSGKFRPYIDAELLIIETLDPLTIKSNTNGTYSTEASKLRRVEIKVLKFNDF